MSSIPNRRGMVPSAGASDPWRVMPAIVQAIEQEAPGIRSYTFQLRQTDDAQSYAFRPGQFNMLYLPGVGEAAMSISSDPGQSHRFTHTVRAVGNVTKSLVRFQVGDSLGIRGPFGSAWPLGRCHQRDIVIVAGGIGLAPLRPVVYSIAAQRAKFGKVSLLIGTRTPEDFLFEDEFQSWQAAGIDLLVTVDRSDEQWAGNIGVVTLLLQRLELQQVGQTTLFTCGPEVMMNYTVRTAIERGIDPSNIWITMERNMNCAIGHCGHCQLGPHFICKDGPVLRYDQLDNWIKVDSL